MTSPQVRDRLVESLRLDLVGPWPGHAFEEERLPGWERPSVWYLTGFLVPSGAPPEQRADADEDDELGETPEAAGLGEESAEERRAAKKAFFPSSVGLSFLVPAGVGALDVTVSWGDYERDEVDEKRQGSKGGGAPVKVWRRRSRSEMVSVSLGTGSKPVTAGVPDSGGLELQVICRPAGGAQLAGRLPSGTRAVSVFLVNGRAAVDDAEGSPDSAFAFQPCVEVQCGSPFVARPDPRGSELGDWDEQVADLHYADSPEYAAGHGISAEWDVADGACRVIRTAWMPSAQVEKTETVDDVPGTVLTMDELGALADGDATRAALLPLVDRYREWIRAQGSSAPNEVDSRDGTGSTACDQLVTQRRETAEQLLHLARSAADRMQGGIEALAEDDNALDAFRVANRAVGAALRRRAPQKRASGSPEADEPSGAESSADPGSSSSVESPRWRSFQLAFILLNLPGLVDPAHGDRKIVDLLFFPTGGGKTEAYLGLAATAMVLRRLRDTGPSAHRGAGVSVVMRYTLRLLTFDQLARAAGLVCALELERDRDPSRYGEWPFEIGLWVGKGATPNVLGHKGDKRRDTALKRTVRYKSDPRSKPSPIPLEECPWCGKPLKPDSFQLEPDDAKPRNLRIRCADFACDFGSDRPLPIVAVDEPLYRRLPAFLIATVDKFASLPWTGACGVLLGGADRVGPHGFYGGSEPGRGARLPAPLPPPDLIVQDELHLISGPLGTMVGLYETAIEALCKRSGAAPKIVASTATVRQAQDQIQALFARPDTQVFPPPGPTRDDSFFARTTSASETPARLYLGIAAQGRNPKVVMRRVVLALMGAAEKAYREAGGRSNKSNPADPYMTLLGYFNSLRELGGARRILEEEVRNTLQRIGNRRRIHVGTASGPSPVRLFRDRRISSDVVELTSRVPTNKVAEARQRLGRASHEDRSVDYAIATNMISVGLDISRLGLMLVQGQPKTHAEYIQATSRVGRDSNRPGLVVTLLNVHKPRDRSHYETFRSYHETFYRSVEVTSVTPFAARALDRGLAGAMVALARHGNPALAPSTGPGCLADARADVEGLLMDVFLERVHDQPVVADDGERDELVRSVRNRIVDLLDSWQRVVDSYGEAGVGVKYQKYEEYRRQNLQPLLRDMLDRDFETEHHRKFRANRSLRDVEPEVNVYVK